MIKEVQCWKAEPNGIQLVFLDNDDMADVYEFHNQADIDYLMNLIRLQVSSETLLVEARDRTQTTVH